MGCFGSSNKKSNKVAPQSAPPPVESRKPSSAPAGLEVDNDFHKREAAPRQLSDNGESWAAGGEKESSKEAGERQSSPQAAPPTPQDKPKPQQAAQAPDASPGLASLLPQAVQIPESAQAWTQVGLSFFPHMDKVVPLYFVSLELLSTVLQAFVGTGPSAPAKPVAAVPIDSLKKGVTSIIPILVHRYSNLNPRIQDTSLQALLNISTSPCLGMAMVTPHLLPAAHGSQQPQREVKLFARLGLLAELLRHLSSLPSSPQAAHDAGREELASVGMPEEAVLQTCREGLDSAEASARMHGMRTLAELHRFKRVRGRQPQGTEDGSSGSPAASEGVSPPLGAGLDPDNCVGTIKPALASLLARRFAEVDAELRGEKTETAGPDALAVEGVGSLKGSFNNPAVMFPSPSGSCGSARGKSQLPPLVGGARSTRLSASSPSSPPAPVRISPHAPLAVQPELARSQPSLTKPSQASPVSRSPIPDTLFNEEDERMLNDLMP
ncbi:hypothetical protein DUNSADRAFT_17402 [Dunaliella salina]|uniref:Uncharacterized protein n=1 Tax=Dunaliella salina TaxID=3046 RepID=A0ABQ7G1T9_DUNSA|nr:hypothetical protein DUNSADRAFT_17402 [Dunaliella salina]|eukprot:KAF5828570.1 hypothetical protein DUNSADRAFT_17402 [Dunaliella salina]